MNKQKLNVIAISSWVIPVCLCILATIFTRVLYPIDNLNDIQKKTFLNIFAITFCSTLLVSSGLAFISEIMSRKSKEKIIRRHAIAGIILSFPLLIVYAISHVLLRILEN